MEKLIELLNEREIGEEGGELYYLSNGIIRDDGGNILYDYRIISKKFGFIKWLVENDKIRELDKLEYVYGIEMVRHGTEELYTPYSLYENLLMLLSISSSPIDDLISYLK